MIAATPVTRGPRSARRLTDLARFGAALIASTDNDPIYPVLRKVNSLLGLEWDEQVWLAYLYLATYDITSALRAFAMTPEPVPNGIVFNADALDSLPLSTERRGLRGGKVADHLLFAIAHWDEQPGYWIKKIVGDPLTPANLYDPRAGRDPVKVRQEIMADVARIHFNGRWAAYKWADLVQHVLGCDLQATDTGVAEESKATGGPRDGLIYAADLRDDADVPALRMAEGEAYRAVRRYLPDATWDQVETVVCNYNSLRKGGYYVGHDIDEMQHRIEAVQASGDLSPAWADILWTARREAIPHGYLGELHGWSGVDKQRNRAYVERGQILARDEEGNSVDV